MGGVRQEDEEDMRVFWLLNVTGGNGPVATGRGRSHQREGGRRGQPGKTKCCPTGGGMRVGSNGGMKWLEGKLSFTLAVSVPLTVADLGLSLKGEGDRGE
ncbi:hypothetical protein WR25_16493 [Diploscapter pachys]|uniref:Uncharacterized protein n=1 Tax=Diploscapter pachys TaxID=2018661 RepID=A0A2A2KJW4_9BILA|nr:hypothetical protein WR25_16493 [Diploscapter pachys]